jgi:hypothetical protein
MTYLINGVPSAPPAPIQYDVVTSSAFVGSETYSMIITPSTPVNTVQIFTREWDGATCPERALIQRSISSATLITPGYSLCSAPTATISVFGEGNGTSMIFTANVTNGSLLDNLTFNGEIQRYSSFNCSTPINPECPFSLTLNAGNTTASSGALCAQGSTQTSRILTLIVNSNNITTNPQIISVGGNTYRIIGFDECGGL